MDQGAGETLQQQRNENLEFFQGQKVLVTGGGGYLASGLIRLLREVDCRILRLTRKGEAGAEPGGRAEILEVPGDVRTADIWERTLEDVQVVFHLAAQTSTYVANADPLADQSSNVLPLLNLLETCRRRGWQPVVVFASTVTVAGLPERLPVDEEHPDHPLTAYDLHKQMAEQYLRWYAEQGWVSAASLRLPNVYGPGPRSSRQDRGILNQMARRALAGEPLTLYGEGEQLRDYLYIEDAARAFLAAAAHCGQLNGRPFVLGSGVGHSIAEALELIAERAAARTGSRVEIRKVPPPEGLSPIEGQNFIADATRFREATGWQPRYSLGEGIDRLMEDLP